MPTPGEYVHKDGSRTWRVRLRDQRRGRETSVTFATKPEAEQFCREVRALGPAAALDRLYAPETPTTPLLDEWATHHIDHLTSVTDGTRLGYRRLYARTWAPLIGHLPLDRITVDTIAVAINTLSARYSDKSVANAHGLLAAMLSGAVERGRIAANPCAATRLPRRTEHERAEHRYLTPQEFLHLLDEIPEHYRPLVTTLAGTGIRWGEAEALTVGDVNTETGSIRITKAAKWNVSRATRDIGPTKTRKSRRTIGAPDEVMEALGPLLHRPRTARLFTAPRGGELRHRTFYDEWKAACQRSGLDPHPRVHDLRHSHVAWLIAGNVPLPMIQARLGHEHITTTIDTYGHLLPDLQVAAVAVTSAALRPVTLALPDGS